MTDSEIETINRIIKEAVIHGADAGGSYDSNECNLIKAISDWLVLKEMTKEFVVKVVRLHDGWIVPQIVDITDVQVYQTEKGGKG